MHMVSNPFIERWRELDHFYQQPVKLILGQHEQTGIALGIDELGAFLLQQGDEVKRYFGGENQCPRHYYLKSAILLGKWRLIGLTSHLSFFTTGLWF